MPSRIRAFIMTWNNYPENWIELIDKAFETKRFRYIIGGKEVGENGTPHIQGHIDQKNGSTIKALQKFLKKADIKCAIKQPKDEHHAANNRNYCKKDHDFTEWGVKPQQGKRNDIEACMETIRAEPRIKTVDLMERHPSVYAKYPAFVHQYKLHKVKHKILQHTDETTPNLWIWGKAGKGKSRPYQELLDKMYPKQINKWWDAYDGEPTVLVEDFAESHVRSMTPHVKIWADRYPFFAQVKNFTVRIRPQRIVVTSNYDSSVIFGAEDIEAITRRFQMINVDEKEEVPLYTKGTSVQKTSVQKKVKPFGELIMRSEQHE